MSFLRNVGNKQNSFLHGYVIETMSLTTLDECFHMCLRKCQCLSFNFNDLNKTQNCELNDATFKMYPEALKEKEGATYYEPAREYLDKNVSKCFIFYHDHAHKWKSDIFTKKPILYLIKTYSYEAA